MTAPRTVAVIGGDGIGPEVIDAAVPVLTAAAAADGHEIRWEHLPYGASHFLETGETLPPPALRHLEHDVDAIFVGALGDPRVPDNRHARDILLGLRFELDLYINFRPCALLHQDLCPLRRGSDLRAPIQPDGTPWDIDFVIFRENTEGSYTGRGSAHDEGTAEETHIAEEVHSAPKVRRIIRAAFEWAAANGRRRITMSDKSNAIPAHRIWGRIFAEVAEGFPGIDTEHRYVDALAMELVRDPERFDVIVTSNLLGDILSDLGAELVGGLGVAGSANLHPGRVGLFEPVHGSAPNLVGTGQANPVAAVLTGALMLHEFGWTGAGGRVRDAVRDALGERAVTPDLGGSATTAEVSAWLTERIGTS